MPIFVVKPKTAPHDEKKHRLVKAENAKAVRAHLLSDYEISEAEAEEAHDLGVQGVQIETAAE